MLGRTESSHLLSPETAFECEQCCGNCKDGCSGCAREGISENQKAVEVEYFRRSSSRSESKVEPNPNSGWIRMGVSLIGSGLAFAKLAVQKISPEADMGMKIASVVVAVGNSCLSCYRNAPLVKSADGREVPNRNYGGNKLDEEKSCGEKLSTKRIIYRLVAVGGGATAGFFLAGPAGAAYGASAGNTAAQMMESMVNCGQERPYFDCSKKSRERHGTPMESLAAGTGERHPMDFSRKNTV